MRELLNQLDNRVSDLRGKLAELAFRPEINPGTTLASLSADYRKHYKAYKALEDEILVLSIIRPHLVTAIKISEQEKAKIAKEEEAKRLLAEQNELLERLDGVAFGSAELADCLVQLADNYRK